MPVILSALSEMLEFSYLFNPLSGRENKSGQEPSMVEGADTQAQETAGAGGEGKNKMEAVSGLCTCGDSHRFGAQGFLYGLHFLL